MRRFNTLAFATNQCNVKYIFVLLISSCVVTDISAQSFATINYSLAEGLPSKEVYEVYQDRNKFIWFATDNGVVRFDGYEMQRFGKAHGLSDLVVFGFHEDYKGRLWFRTFSGKLSYWYNDSIYQYPYNDIIEKVNTSGIISSIFVDSLDNLWFATYQSGPPVIASIDIHGNLQTETPNGNIFFKSFSNGQLFGTGFAPNYSFSVDNKIFPHDAKFYCGFPVAIKWHGKILMVFCQRIFEFDGSRKIEVFAAKAPIISLSKDKNNHLWVGYQNAGAEEFVSPDFSNGRSLPFLQEQSVTEVIQDHESGFWFTTLHKGVFYVPDISIVNKQLPEGYETHYLAQRRSKIYVGTNKGAVLLLDSQGTVTKKLQMKPPLRGMYADKIGNVWINDGITSCFDSLLRKQLTLPIAVSNASEDDLGNIWTVGGSTRTVGRFSLLDKSQRRISRLPFFCYNIHIHKDSVIYIAKRNGLCITDTTFTTFNDVHSLRDFKIKDLLELNDSIMLLTTIGEGFVVLNTRTNMHLNYNMYNKFIANNIYDCLKTNEHVWLGTEAGLVRLKLDHLLSGNLDFEVLSELNGLLKTQVTHLAEQRDHIWAFSETGFSIVDKNKSHFSLASPLFYLRSIKVNDKKIRLDKTIHLKYDENNLKAEIGFISFKNTKTFIRHRLNENSPWIYSSSRSLELLALPPGSYKLIIEYSTDNIHWTPAYNSPLLVIDPPLWKRWYFQTVIALFVLLIIFLYFRNQLLTYRRYQQKLIMSELETIEKERSRIAKDLHDSVGTDLTAIKMKVNQELQKYNISKTEEIESQFQNTIGEIKGIIYDLSPPGLERYGLIAGLGNYVNKLNGSLPVKIGFNTFGKEVKDPVISIGVFRIIQELISNTIKHSNASQINIHINSFEDLLSVVYEDNGKGFSFDHNHKGLGLYNIESRIQSMHGKLTFESGIFGISYSIDIPVRT